MFNWNETWPDGTCIVPAPGMLVEYERTWVVIGVTDHAQLCDWQTRSTPLAPAPTPGGLWAALESLMPLPHARMKLEAGSIIWSRCSFGPVVYRYHNPRPGIMLAATYEAHMRDMQKYGALLAYCAQPGWDDISAPKEQP